MAVPTFDDRRERGFEEWARPNWRGRLVSWMFNQALRKEALEGRHRHVQAAGHVEPGDWRALNANGLPGGLEWEEFVAFSSRFRYLQNIAGTRPPQLLKWSGEGWLLPRAYTDLLGRWELREVEPDDQGPAVLLLHRAGLVLGCLARSYNLGVTGGGPGHSDHPRCHR
ncbi:hypothetical protein ACFY04_07830 [Streptomyces sp. NPDC001549]|uniref:hypothetical protein n=1 Tax=Streptomyces sp. NPDC001549 TaxID=3364586 RepID=UPI0036A753A9